MADDKKKPDIHPALIAALPVADGQLAIGGLPVERLAARVGRTPFYAYDRALVSRRVGELRTHLPEGVHVNYAVKANPMPALAQHLAGLVDGFDVASGGELKMVLDTPMPAGRISFAGPGKTDAELEQAVAAGVTLHVESVTEARRLAAAGQRLGLQPVAAVRVNPDFELKGFGMRMGGGAQQFGIDAEEVPAVLGEMQGLGIDVVGFHIFTGSQNLKAQVLVDAQAAIIDLALRLADGVTGGLRHVNIGGGFGIPYFSSDPRLDLAVVGESLQGPVDKVRAAHPGAEVIVELGRYLVGESGYYVTRVVDRKVSRGQVYLVTDGGLNHHLTASGNLGQVIRRNFPVVIGNRLGAAATGPASVVGPLCTPLDLLADKMDLPDAQVGDLVVILQSGAYGPSASPAGFLGHPPAVEVLV
ncbi:MAG: pyridoxal-dependent decarboxylase, exosortase A system-associated [Rhodobacterales bacterium]|nr:pyridoxal-dependent decarboxylase, exosortase A system-associated [Rhodobacterales bacterium]